MKLSSCLTVFAAWQDVSGAVLGLSASGVLEACIEKLVLKRTRFCQASSRREWSRKGDMYAGRRFTVKNVC